MKALHLEQGSPEWKAHRLLHFNASDAPAMMGCSPYKTRTQLLHELHGGIGADVNAATQRLFDEGHRFEALARPVAEEIVGDDLYPVVGVDGRLSASFDGLTAGHDVAWEHKSLNDELRRAIEPVDAPWNESTAIPVLTAAFPLHYRVQMEQQILVSGAQRVLFSASRWSDDGQLIEIRHAWYLPDLELRAQIVAGWEQFAKDLDAFVPQEPAAPKPVAEPIKALPALVIQLRGEVVTSNLVGFQQAAEKFLAGIKTELQTDQDFVDADATVKFCEEVESRIEGAKAAALAPMASVDELMRTLDHISEQVRAKRLELKRLVDAEKARRKNEIVAKARTAYADHVRKLESEIEPVRLMVPMPDFAEAAKNKRTLASLQDAVDTALARGKILADDHAGALRQRLAWFRSAEGAQGFEFLFADLATLVHKQTDDLKLAVGARIAAHKQAEEAKKAAAAAPAPAPAAPAEPIGRASKKVITEVPTLKLGTICERLGFTMTSAFIADTLGVHGKTEGRTVLYTASQFQQICVRVGEHARAVAAKTDALELA